MGDWGFAMVMFGAEGGGTGEWKETETCEAHITHNKEVHFISTINFSAFLTALHETFVLDMQVDTFDHPLTQIKNFL